MPEYPRPCPQDAIDQLHGPAVGIHDRPPCQHFGISDPLCGPGRRLGELGFFVSRLSFYFPHPLDPETSGRRPTSRSGPTPWRSTRDASLQISWFRCRRGGPGTAGPHRGTGHDEVGRAGRHVLKEWINPSPVGAWTHELLLPRHVAPPPRWLTLSVAMTEGAGPQRRDHSAWPRGATPLSLIIGVTSLVVGVSMVGNADEPLLPLLVLVVGTGIGATLVVVGIRRWLAGGHLPLVLALISGVSAVVAIVLITATDSPTGPALLCGLLGGLMFANVWAIRAARGRRPTPAP